MNKFVCFQFVSLFPFLVLTSDPHCQINIEDTDQAFIIFL